MWKETRIQWTPGTKPKLLQQKMSNLLKENDIPKGLEPWLDKEITVSWASVHWLYRNVKKIGNFLL